MFKTLAIIKKNLKILVRSKTSALIILLGPLVVILLVAAAFNTTTLSNIKVASYSESYSELTESILDQLSSDQFSVIRMDSEELCIEGIKTGNHHVCAVFDSDLSVSSENNNIDLYADNSRVNLVWIVLDSISKKITSKTTELSKELTSTLLATLKTTEVEMSNQLDKISSLTSSNTQVGSKLDNIGTSISSITLELSLADLDIGAIKDQAESLEASANSSSSVSSLLDDLELKIVELKTKVDEVNSVRLSVSSDISSLKSSVSSSSSDVESLKSSVDTIKASIEAIKIRDPEIITSPIRSTIKPITSKATHLSFLFPTLLVLITMFISLLLASSLIIREKTTAVYFRNFITPTSTGVFVFANYLTNLLIIAVQLVIIIVVALFFFKQNLTNVMPLTALVLFISATLFISLGMLIGYLFRSEETSTLASISVGSIFLFFSNTILPLESLPEFFMKLANINPFVLVENSLKKILLFEVGFLDIYMAVLILVVYIAVFFILIWLTMQITKETIKLKRYLEKRKSV